MDRPFFAPFRAPWPLHGADWSRISGNWARMGLPGVGPMPVPLWLRRNRRRTARDAEVPTACGQPPLRVCCPSVSLRSGCLTDTIPVDVSRGLEVASHHVDHG